MSFGFGIGDFLAVFTLINGVRKDFLGAPGQFQDISNDLAHLGSTIVGIGLRLSSQKLSKAQERRLSDIIRSCSRTIEETKSKLDGYPALRSRALRRKEKFSRVWQALKWNTGDFKDLRSQIATNLFQLDSFADELNRGNIDRLVLRQNQQEEQEILDWLTSTGYCDKQTDLINRRQSGTGQWLLDSSEYQHWLNTKKEVLFCPGNPGAGKTILSAIVVDNLLDLYNTDPSVGICYIFLDFGRTHDQQHSDLIACMVKQLAETKQPLSECVKSLYDRHKQKHTRPLLDELRQTLHSIVTEFSRVFVVIDALDECQVSDHCRERFIDELMNLWSKSDANIFATSRFIPVITSAFENAVKKEIRASNDDIASYIDGNCSFLEDFRSHETLLVDIKKSVLECANGVFLFAKLHLDSLSSQPSPKAIYRALQNFSRKPGSSDTYDVAYYDATYDDAMNRIKSQVSPQVKLALETLSWITLAKRPLTTLELVHALGVEIGETCLDQTNLPALRRLVSYCCGLVTVDEQSGVVRLVHYTAQEYFERTRDFWFPHASSRIAKTCLTYLSFAAFESGPCETLSELNERLELYPFYDYASRFWGQHASTKSDYQLCCDFLFKTPQVGACGQALLTQRLEDFFEKLNALTGLHLAAFFGLDEVIRSLGQGHELNPIDSYGDTPLSYAILNGHLSAVEIFLEGGVDIESRSNGMTPLLLASYHGHTAVVKLILERGARVDSPRNEYAWEVNRTSLSYAAERGHGAIVKLLLDAGALVDSQGTNEWYRVVRTPLSYAAERGHEAIVKLLLDRGANTNVGIIDNPMMLDLGTPLSYAVEGGHDAIVRLLLDSGAEPDLAHSNGSLNSRSTPLSYAAQKGYETIVELLLDKGAAADSNPRFGEKTPLLCAAGRGHGTIVRLLLDRGANVNAKDRNNRTPLLVAAERGHEAVVRLMLDRDVEVNHRDKYGRTLLSYAAIQGYEAIVRLLLDRGAEVDSNDEYNRTPLSYAAERGFKNIVRLLLDRKAEINSKAVCGTTPLAFAVDRRNEAVIQLLEERGAVTGANTEVSGSDNTIEEMLEPFPHRSRGRVSRTLEQADS